MAKMNKIICVSTHIDEVAKHRDKLGVSKEVRYGLEDIEPFVNVKIDASGTKLRSAGWFDDNAIIQLTNRNIYFGRDLFLARTNPETISCLCEFKDTPEHDDGYKYEKVGPLSGWYELYDMVTGVVGKIRSGKGEDFCFFAEHVTHIIVELNSGVRIKFFHGYWFYG